jgi:hypothetical protein
MEQQLHNEIHECCRWCRRPTAYCRESSCDDTPTYPGTLHLGEWVEVQAGATSGAE